MPFVKSKINFVPKEGSDSLTSRGLLSTTLVCVCACVHACAHVCFLGSLVPHLTVPGVGNSLRLLSLTLTPTSSSAAFPLLSLLSGSEQPVSTLVFVRTVAASRLLFSKLHTP